MYKLQVIRLAVLALCLACPLIALGGGSLARFDYQGVLHLNGQPFNGVATFKLTLYDAPTGGNFIDTAYWVEGVGHNGPVQVHNGLFQLHEIEYLTPWWARTWLEITVDPGGPNEAVLSPRHRITSAPRATISDSGYTGDLGFQILNHQNTAVARFNSSGSLGIFSGPPRSQLSIGQNLDLFSGAGASSSPGADRSRIRASGANLVLSAPGTGAVYINHDSGSGGVRFHNGTSGGEMMRLASNGRLGIGTSNPQSMLHVADATRTGALHISNLGLLNTSTALDICVTNSGDWRRVQYCSSSGRYKEQVVPLGQASQLLSALRPARFVWRDDGRPDLGLIAEEVAEVIPELATRDDNGEMIGVNYRHLTAVLIAGWQELQSELAARQAEITALRAELDTERHATANRLATLEALLLVDRAMAVQTTQ
jgi:hypothetical protein